MTLGTYYGLRGFNISAFLGAWYYQTKSNMHVFFSVLAVLDSPNGGQFSLTF
jgi:hypothetical protein